jgi:hypothetical protein
MTHRDAAADLSDFLDFSGSAFAEPPSWPRRWPARPSSLAKKAVLGKTNRLPDR